MRSGEHVPSTADYLEIAGRRLFVQAWGEGQHPLVCLHGLGGGGHLFAGLGAALGARARVVAPDLPGCGHSETASSFSFEECRDAVVALCRQQGWSGVTLLGHSMGTIVALEAIRSDPSLAAGLVAVGGVPEPGPESRSRFRARAERVERAGLAGLAREVIEANFSRRAQREHPELMALFGRAFELQPAERYRDAVRALADWKAPPLPPLDGIRCLAVTGDEDVYAPPAAVRAFAATLPADSAVEILPACGHLPFLEYPAAFASMVGEFLNRLRVL